MSRMQLDRLKGKLKKIFKLSPPRTIVFGYAGIILLGAFLLSLPFSHNAGEWYPFIDSLFTSTSAVCVTGLSVADTAVEFSLFGQIVIMFLIQIGGLGFMTMTTIVFIIIGKRITLKDRLVIKEALSEHSLQGLVKFTKRILLYTLIFESLGAVLLMIAFIPEFGFWDGFYKSIFHSISAFCNAGFDIMGANKGVFDGMGSYVSNVLVSLTLIFLIVTGGLGLCVIADIASYRKSKRLMFHTKVVLWATAGLILVSTVVYMCMEYYNPATIGNLSFGEKFLVCLFQAVTPRTAGFSTVDQAALTEGSSVFTMFLMFVGASPASTGGGIKTTTFIILMLILSAGIRGKKEIVFRKYNIDKELMLKTMAVAILGLTVVFTLTFILSLTEANNAALNTMFGENAFETFLFEAFSAFSTVGLTKGITPYLSASGKCFVALTMLIGRVGALLFGLSLAGKGDNVNIKYQDAKILVG